MSGHSTVACIDLIVDDLTHVTCSGGIVQFLSRNQLKITKIESYGVSLLFWAKSTQVWLLSLLLWDWIRTIWEANHCYENVQICPNEIFKYSITGPPSRRARVGTAQAQRGPTHVDRVGTAQLAIVGFKQFWMWALYSNCVGQPVSPGGHSPPKSTGRLCRGRKNKVWVWHGLTWVLGFAWDGPRSYCTAPGSKTAWKRRGPTRAISNKP